MATSLRSIVKKQQQELALKDYLGRAYSTTSEPQKRKFLEAVDETIENEVTQILNAFIEEVTKGSPESKRRKTRAYLNTIITLICTPGIAYSVNMEIWIMVIVLSAILLLVQGYVIKSEY